jgi:tetratricopeptide (TPR) repeat protein
MMRTARLTFCSLATIAFGLTCAAQSPAQFIIWGDNAIRLNDFYGASRFYAEALEQEAGRLELQWKYAEACRLSNQYPQAAASYEKVARKDLGRSHPEALRWLGEMQLCSGQYDEAQKTWQKVKQKEKDKGSILSQRADNAMEGIRMAKANAIADSITVDHLPEPVNSFDSEFAPRSGPDSLLYFTSLRGELTHDDEVKDSANYHARLFRSKEAMEKWSAVTGLSDAINDAHTNANSAWSLDGRWFYFARDDGHGAFALMAHDLSHPEQAPVMVHGEYGRNYTQPMVAEWNGKQTLFFTWQDIAGHGDMNLRCADIDGTTLANIRPVDAALDGPGNECTPWFDAASHTLWFSSDFLPGYGGFDIHRVDLRGDKAGAPMNAGLPLNSPANDLYATYDAASRTGWFTSNRVGSLAKKGATCCNDIYRFSLPHSALEASRRVVKDDTMTVAERRITSLREKLPIRLYFHNDEPDPRSWDTLTALTYEQTYRSYKALVPDYHTAWGDNNEGRKAIDGFFRDRVDLGSSQLNEFIALLKQALGEGQRIELQVRGFASPLAKSDYNANLSLRRISSLVNQLRTAESGVLRPYLDTGALLIRKSPFGENTSASGVSDQLQDLKGSVYSVGASMERRIEIEQVMLTPEPERARSSMAMELTRDIGTVSRSEPRRIPFTVKNTGMRPLKLVRMRPDCDCTVVNELPEDAIPAGGSTEVIVEFNGRSPVGPLNKGVTIFTDGEPATIRLVITGTLTDL